MRSFVIILILALILLSTGCTNSGGVTTGAITGKMMRLGSDGLPTNIEIPAEEFRIEAFKGAGTEDKNNNYLYKVTTDEGGCFTISDLPVGIYTIRLIGPAWMDAWGFYMNASTGAPTPGGSSTSSLTQVAYDINAAASEEPGNIAPGTTVPGVLIAFVHSGKVYELPTLYCAPKTGNSKPGAIEGKVFSRITNQPIKDATVIISYTDYIKGAMFRSLKTDSMGRYAFTDIPTTSGANVTLVVNATNFLPRDSLTVQIPAMDLLKFDIGLDHMLDSVLTGKVKIPNELTPYIQNANSLDNSLAQLITSFQIEGYSRIYSATEVSLSDSGTFSIPQVPAGLSDYTVIISGPHIKTDMSNPLGYVLNDHQQGEITGLELKMNKITIPLVIDTSGIKQTETHNITFRIEPENITQGSIFASGQSKSNIANLEVYPFPATKITVYGGSNLKSPSNPDGGASIPDTTLKLTQNMEFIQPYTIFVP